MAGVGAMKAKNDSRGLEFLVGVDVAFTVYSGTNSSPQTTDVFGDENRLASLWKYVRIGGVLTFICVGISSALDRSPWALVGGVFAGGIMHGLYHHAASQARQRNDGTLQDGSERPQAQPYLGPRPRG
jgi:hypothetical protein